MPTARMRKSSSRGNTSPVNPDLQQKIIDCLKRYNYPLRPLKIAKGVGLNAASQVTQTLYLMQNRGFVSKVKQKPVEWALVPHALSSGSSSDESDQKPSGDAMFESEQTIASEMEDVSNVTKLVDDSVPNVDLNLEVSMPGDEADYNQSVKSNNEMLIDGAGLIEHFDESKTPEHDLQESPEDMETTFQRPDSCAISDSEGSGVNDETLAELKRLVEESVPTKDDSLDENIQESEVENMECGNNASNKTLEDTPSDKTSEDPQTDETQEDLINHNRHISAVKLELEDPGYDGKMETSEIVKHVAKKQRITDDNAVLMAMMRPSPQIKRQKEFDVPTETGMLPFKTSQKHTPVQTVGRGRASSLSSSGSFSRPLPPHEWLRMRGELPLAAEEAFSQQTYNKPQPLPGVGRGRGIIASQLSIPGQVRQQFSPTGDVAPLLTPSPWTQSRGRGSIQSTGHVGAGSHNSGPVGGVQQGPRQGGALQCSASKLETLKLLPSVPPPLPPDSWTRLNQQTKTVQNTDQPSRYPVASLQNAIGNKPAFQSLVALSHSKPAPSSSSSFKLPPTPFDLVKNTTTWGTGTTEPLEDKSPEIEAQNAFLSALNVPTNENTSQSQFGQNSLKFGNKSQNSNFGNNIQNFGNSSNFGGISNNFGSNFGSNLNFDNGSNVRSGLPGRPALGLSSAPVAQSTMLSTKITGLTHNDMDSSRSSGSGFSSESFNMLNKNPISALSEYAQTRKLQLQIKIVGESGPAHKKRFQMAAFVGKERFPAVCGTNKKDCRKEAADVALRALMADGKYQSNKEKTVNTPKIPMPNAPATHFDNVAALSHSAFNTLAARIMENLSGRKVLAALVMKKGPNDGGSVVSLGTGNRCITGPQMSLEGHTVNDSHAEIVTRRGFIRFLYKHLETDTPGSADSLFEPSPSGKLKIKDGITFHLYISTAPCGDGALFSPRDAEGATVKEGENKIEHTPTFTTAVQGIVRTKIEGGEGTIPLEPGFMGQTWDGILRGERLRTMSCSDKLCRWNILGMQGALLTHFLDPIYLSTLTLGYLYDHGHLARALCCRLSRGEPPIEDLLPPYYKLNHPHLGRVTMYAPQRGTEKTKSVSLNWCAGDSGAEVLDGAIGQVIDKSRTNVISRVAKKNLYESFKALCVKFNKSELLEADNYYAAKREAKDFQAVKKVMIERLRKNKLGPWVQKPMEEKMFV
ncbi:uncharacterized protein LOC135492078 [Lineus longissimus]|uniref:uncharacterized protein LOC135492078 n=1 Tax=Lineus longissimus TaxID=88925 RepID=UPI00315DB7F2